MKTIIIGAGISGLSAANSIDGETTIVESQPTPGGYCRTTIRNGYVWDRAGHFFHFNNKNAQRFFNDDVLGDDYVTCQKRTAISYEGRYIDFPFQSNIHQLPKDEYISCLIDLFEASTNSQEARSFKDYVISKFGASISSKFLIPYNEKLYSCNLDELDKDAMGRFIPTPNFEDVLLAPRRGVAKSYNEEFSYPRRGAQQLVDRLVARLDSQTELKLGVSVNSISLLEKTLVLSSGEVLPYDAIISTTPLPKLLGLIGRSVPSFLKSNSVKVFNIGYDCPAQTDLHWIYFPGDEIYYRVGCYSNIFKSEKASFYIEVGTQSGRTIDELELLRMVDAQLKQDSLISDSAKIVDFEFVDMDPAYVHISRESEDFKSQFLAEMRDDFNIFCVGRYGEWKYCSIEDNMLDAAHTVKSMAAKGLVPGFRDFMGLGIAHQINEE